MPTIPCVLPLIQVQSTFSATDCSCIHKYQVSPKFLVNSNWAYKISLDDFTNFSHFESELFLIYWFKMSTHLPLVKPFQVLAHTHTDNGDLFTTSFSVSCELHQISIKAPYGPSFIYMKNSCEPIKSILSVQGKVDLWSYIMTQCLLIGTPIP